MSTINKVRRSSPRAEGAHLNWMGGRSWDIRHPVTRLRVAASSCFFGEPMYYHDAKDAPRKPGAHRTSALTDRDRDHLRETLHAIDPVAWRALSPAALMESAIDAALDHDPEGTLLEAARLRNDEHLRTTPQVILVRAANHAKVRGTGLVRRHAAEIVRRPDEPSVGLAYQLHRFGKPVPNALKRAWASALVAAKEHGLAKYRMESRAVKTVDVVNLVHPKSKAVSRLVKGELTVRDRTWEAIVSAKGSTPAAWTEALGVMGHMALLRNLRNLLQAEVPVARFADALVRGAKDGQQLPFRYYSAYRAVQDQAPAPLLDALEQCLETSLGALPRFAGRVASLCDNSGSAQGTTTSSMGSMQVSTIANLSGILAGRCADEGWLGVFGDRLEMTPVRKKASVFDALKAADATAKGIGMSTENGIWLFWDNAIRKKEHWDTVFIFSDMQAGHGGLYGTSPSSYKDYQWRGGHNIDVAKLIAAYRARVNPSVDVFLVQVAGYQDTLVPEFYDRTYILGGWGEGLLRFAAAMKSLPQG
ncbi:MAG: TROVE domain-containing protein [Polyangiales bacterium]